jgi:HD-GYP domain-containing protein (c-di-GMP phosphodiesterase class II)
MLNKDLDPKTLAKIRRETLDRCRILPWSEQSSGLYRKVYVDHLHFLYDVNTVDFSLYLKIENVLIEYIKPREFSKTYLQNLLAAILGKNETLAIYVSNMDSITFNTTISLLRNKRLSELYKSHSELDRETIHVYDSLSNMAQLISMFGVNSKVVKKVKANVNSAVKSVSSNKDSTATLVRILGYDKTLYDHSAMVALLSTCIAANLDHLGLANEELTLVAMCGVFHDVGESLLPTNLVHKKGLYTAEEKHEIKAHVNEGYKYLKNKEVAELNPVIARVAYEHHERFDGSGYPNGLVGRGEEHKGGAHLYSRIIAIADVFSALLMETSYKKAFEPTECLKILISTSSDFDPLILKSFIKHVIGSFKHTNQKNSSGRIFSFNNTKKQYYG